MKTKLGINSPEQMEEIIASGQADYIVLDRQSLADPELADKAENSEEDRTAAACSSSPMWILTSPT